MKANQAKEFEKNDYGVFLNADASSLERFKTYETRIGDFKQYVGKTIVYNVYMDLQGKKSLLGILYINSFLIHDTMCTS